MFNPHLSLSYLSPKIIQLHISWIGLPYCWETWTLIWLDLFPTKFHHFNILQTNKEFFKVGHYLWNSYQKMILGSEGQRWFFLNNSNNNNSHKSNIVLDVCFEKKTFISRHARKYKSRHYKKIQNKNQQTKKFDECSCQRNTSILTWQF